ncbi:MAG: helix-turn-helix domain-containing protein [Pseudomonadota bacterium]|nr:helix-turn-helix domain-containing protein [Pseudomonadota bacterium]
MSKETLAWAKQQRCGSATAKAVLLELANWARANGICEYRRVKDIARVIEVSERSVQRALHKLEAGPDEGGLALIRRMRRRGKDGGQLANCFELVGYVPGDTMSLPPDTRSLGRRHGGGGPGDRDVTPYLNQESENKKCARGPNSLSGLRSSHRCEDERSHRLRAALICRIPAAEWACCGAAQAFIFDDPGLKIFAPSEFMRERFEFQFGRLVPEVLHKLAIPVTWITHEVEKFSSPQTSANVDFPKGSPIAGLHADEGGKDVLS